MPKVFVVAAGGLSGPGGIGRLVSATAHHWRAADLQPPLRVIDPYGRRLSPLTPLHLARALWQIAWNARRGRIALLHVHMALRGSAVRKGIIIRLAAWLGVPIILHTQGSRLDEIHPRLPARVRRALHRTFDLANRIIVPGKYWRGVLVDRVGVDAAVVRVISNAVAGPPQLAPRPDLPPCRLLFLGNLTALKGLPDLLQALAHPDLAPLAWRVQVAGPGDVGACTRRAAALGIADRVEFLGWVAEAGVIELLARADIFVLPSRNEGLSLAVLEAMAHGCAVVTTPVGATRDAVTDGESGLLVPVGDPQQLAMALQRLIADPALRARLRSNARQAWSDHFDIAAHCRQLVALYGEVTSDQP